MRVEILPSHVARWNTSVRIDALPPDKSIFHRLLIIGSMSESKITIPISSIEEIPSDVFATILALESLGVPIEIYRSKIIVQGVGINGFHAPKHQINCANSGTTARLMMGLLAGQNFSSTLIGDTYLSRRPMKRLADILNNDLGADISTSDDGTLPILINGQKLHSANIELQVASAQMKSALLIAGFYADGEVSVTEPLQSRDHTERMLKAFGKGFTKQGLKNSIYDYHFSTPPEFTYKIPGDFSSAAFLIGAAVLIKRDLLLMEVGLNNTRARMLPILEASSATRVKNPNSEPSQKPTHYILTVEVWDIRYDPWDEKFGNIDLFASQTSPVKPFIFFDDEAPIIIDEIPILAAIAAFCNGTTEFKNLRELRKKESDRISSITKNLKAFGASLEETEDGFIVHGNEDFIPAGGIIEHFGDHRIAMALSILALRAEEAVTISDAEIVSVSYPNFYKDLAMIVGKERIRIS